MIESMACGTPVIATRYGAVPEVMGDGQGGIVVGDWREIPEAIERIDDVDPLDCRHYVEERFAPERMVADYEEAYRKVI
jgi:glycosyltransferase involved in cell wall biosynthesis